MSSPELDQLLQKHEVSCEDNRKLTVCLNRLGSYYGKLKIGQRLHHHEVALKTDLFIWEGTNPAMETLLAWHAYEPYVSMCFP